MANLRIASTVASADGMRTAAANDKRIAVAMEAIEWGATHDAALLVLPAGFLWAQHARDVLRVSKRIVDRARRLGIAILVGVDTCASAWQKLSRDAAIKKQTLPYFCAVWAPGSKTTVLRQRSTSSGNAHLAPPAVWSQQRDVIAPRITFLPVICGEAFSAPLRGALKTAARAAPLAAVLTHIAQGNRHFHAERAFAGLGIATLRSVHAKNGAKSRLCLPNGAHQAPSRVQGFRKGSYWMEAYLFEQP